MTQIQPVRKPGEEETGTNAAPARDFLADLGEPFASFGRALLDADDAAKRVQAAEVAGDIAAKNKAELERDEARGRVQAVRDHESARVCFGLRSALLTNPAALVAQIDEALAQSSVVAEIRANLTELAGAVAALEGRRAGRVAA